MKRTFVIGDIHGALNALTQLIERIVPEPGDRLIFLGDYVDGWSQSAEVIAYLMQLESRFLCVFIKGNHDIWCEDWLLGKPADMTWLVHGGSATIDSYRACSEKEKQEHAAFFGRMYDYYVDEQNRLYVHAGFSSLHGPAYERYSNNCAWDRTLWELALAVNNRIEPGSIFYPKRLSLFKEIYIGHTPTLGYGTDMPMNGCNVWNLDTGAAYYGKLSAMNPETKAIYQSDIVQTLYPGEMGRNK